MSSSLLPRLSAVALSLVLLAGFAAQAAVPGGIERVSVATNGQEGIFASDGPLSLSADGRYVSFETRSNLSLADTNGLSDVYVRDRVTGLTQLVSLGNPATPTGQRVIGNNASTQSALSADGKYVAFASLATNLVTGDTNNASDVFMRGRSGSVIRVSVTSAAAQADQASGQVLDLSGDGSVVAYTSNATNLVTGDSNALTDVFATSIQIDPLTGGLQTGTTIRASTDSAGVQADGVSGEPSVSFDGRYVAFSSVATNLDPDDLNDLSDIFVKDTLTGQLVRVSVDSDGFEGDGDSVHPFISADGRFVVFASDATTLDPDDTNGLWDVFVHDRDADQNGIYDELDGISTVRVSESEFGDEGDDDSGLEPVAGRLATARPSISADGRFVTFISNADNLGSDFDNNLVTDVFLHDRDADGDGFFDDDGGTTTERLSLDNSGTEGDGTSFFSQISLDGNAVAFVSDSTNLVFDDFNSVGDVYVWQALSDSSTNEPPDVVIANDDQFVEEGDTVLLDASGTTDFENDFLTFSWTQVSGDNAVVLSDPTSPTPTFIAPLVSNFDVLEFEVSVSDGINEPETAIATVTVGLATPATLTGKVLDSGLSGVANAEIRVIRTDGEEASTQYSDSDGFYTVDDVRVGTNTIVVSAFGFETMTQEITVSPGEVVNLDLILDTPAATFRGNVFLSNGAPLPDADVQFVDRFGDVIDETTTDGSGEFTIENLDHVEINAAVAIHIQRPGYITWIDANARIPAGQITTRDYQYGRLQVVVKASPKKLEKQLNGTTVILSNLKDDSDENPTGTVSKKAPKLNFLNVPAGPVQVRAINPALTGALVTVTVRPGSKVTKAIATLRARNIF
jgi:Tol biopolymer transport system component